MEPGCSEAYPLLGQVCLLVNLIGQGHLITLQARLGSSPWCLGTQKIQYTWLFMVPLQHICKIKSINKVKQCGHVVMPINISKVGRTFAAKHTESLLEAKGVLESWKTFLTFSICRRPEGGTDNYAFYEPVWKACVGKLKLSVHQRSNRWRRICLCSHNK